MNLRAMIKDQIEKTGADGLFNNVHNCYCLIDDMFGLFHCDDVRETCEIGKKAACEPSFCTKHLHKHHLDGVDHEYR